MASTFAGGSSTNVLSDRERQEETLDQVKNALRSLTQSICGQLEGVAIPTRPVSTVVRPALSDLRVGLTLSLLELPEYKAAAEAIENDPELGEGIIIDAGGTLQKQMGFGEGVLAGVFGVEGVQAGDEGWGLAVM